MASRMMILVLAMFMVTMFAPMTSAVYQLEYVGSFGIEKYDSDAAEKVAWDPVEKAALVTNADEGKVDVISFEDPTNPVKIGELDAISDVTADPRTADDFVGDSVQAIEASNNLLFVAVVAEDGPGYLAIYSLAGLTYLGSVQVNAAPDALAVSADGTVVAGVSSGGDDTAGSVFIIKLDDSICAPGCVEYFKNGGTGFISETANYEVPDFGSVEELRSLGVRIADPSVATNIQLAPEAIALSADGTLAIVNYQENNAVSAFNTTTGEFLWIDTYGTEIMTLDPSDKDDAIALASQWGGVTVKGLHMPDEIDFFTVDGTTYIVTANEGSGDDVRIGDVGTTCANNDYIVQENVLGRLKVIDSYPVEFDASGAIVCDTITTHSTRSFSVYRIDDDGVTMMYDSGTEMAEKVASTNPNFFNSDDTANDFEGRSDDKGVEPEGIKIGTMPDGRILAFISSERVSGVFVYDVSDPSNPVFQDYFNRRNFGDVDIDDQVDTGIFTFASLDVGPENFAFIKPKDSPTCQTALLVANPPTGTTTLYNVVEMPEIREGDGHCESASECDALYGAPVDLSVATRACPLS